MSEHEDNPIMGLIDVEVPATPIGTQPSRLLAPGPQPVFAVPPTPSAPPVPVQAPTTVKMVTNKVAELSKFVTAVIGLGITFASQYYGTNHWVVFAVAVASALGVYAVPNRQGTAVASPAIPPAGKL